MVNRQRQIRFHRFRNGTRSKSGFVMPVVLVVSLAMIAIGLSLIQTTASIRMSIASQYTTQLAQEAAESGAVYANYCYTKSGAALWAGSQLTPHTDCQGTAVSTYPSYITTNSMYQSSFSVGDIEASGSSTKVINAQGTANTLAGGTVVAGLTTSSYNQKEVLNSLLLKASQSASGKWKTCGIVSDKLYCWGWNSDTVPPAPYEPFNGNLGDGTTTTRTVPTAVVTTNFQPGEIPVKVATGQYHSCVMTQMQNVYCWGSDSWGILADGNTSGYSAIPVAIGGAIAGKTTDIAVAGNTTCVIAASQIYCWGGNQYGTAGITNDASHQKITTPTLVATSATSVKLHSGYTATSLSSSGVLTNFMCAIANSQPYCWGDNEVGQVGTGGTSSAVIGPTAVSTSGSLAGKTVTDLTRGGLWYQSPDYGFTCALASGSVYCWGNNAEGELGNGGATGTKSLTAYPVSPSADGTFTNTNVTAIYAGNTHMCALSGGHVYCWGSNQAGQLGTGSGTSSNIPVAVSTSGVLNGLTVTQIGGGGDRGCAVANFTNYCWGGNPYYQIGDGTKINRPTPTTSVFLQPTGNQYLF